MIERRRRGRPANEPTSTRAKLLAAAAAAFNTDGYFGTDTNKIARAAGFAPATFYQHFANKKEIFVEAYRHWVDADWQVIEKAIGSEKAPRKIARAIVRAHSAHHGKWVELRLSMHGLVATDKDCRKSYLQARADQLTRMRRLLNGLKAPRLSQGDLLYSFLCIERASNAVTDGDIEALRIPRNEMLKQIESEIVYLLTGRHSDRSKRR